MKRITLTVSLLAALALPSAAAARPHHAAHHHAPRRALSAEARCLANENNEWDEYTRADNGRPETLCRPIGKEHATPPGVVATITLPL